MFHRPFPDRSEDSDGGFKLDRCGKVGTGRIDAGRVRLVLGTDDSLPDAFRAKDNPGLLLCDEKGTLRAHLYASEEMTGLGLFDPDGKPRAALTHRNGWSGMFLKDRGDAIRVGMALDSGGPHFVVQDEKERVLFGQP